MKDPVGKADGWEEDEEEDVKNQVRRRDVSRDEKEMTDGR